MRSHIALGRAGWYSYDIFDNLGRHSSERFVPELQRIKVGDLVPLGPGENSGMLVKEFVVGQSMLWWTGKGRTDDALPVPAAQNCRPRLSEIF